MILQCEGVHNLCTGVVNRYYYVPGRKGSRENACAREDMFCFFFVFCFFFFFLEYKKK